MRVLYLGKKQGATAGLNYLLEKNIEVVAVVAKPKGLAFPFNDGLWETAERLGIPITSDEEIYRCLSTGEHPKEFELKDIDLVISYLYWNKIKNPLIKLAKSGCLNFHPAPLPEYRGASVYSFGIWNRTPEWGVSAHFINDESFDTGDLIKVTRFPINPDEESEYSLVQKSQSHLLALFKTIIGNFCQTGSLPRIPQDPSKAHYYSMAELEKIRKIQPNDDPETIDRKVRACFFPPYPGAYMEINGRQIEVMTEKLRKQVSTFFRDPF